MNSIPSRPFGTMALSFSGGGFRAAAYGLGSLSYLHHARIQVPDEAEMPLLNRVGFMASASGGSFASLTYATYLYAGRPFADGYHALRDFMQGELLVKQVVAQLSDDTVWERHPTKQRNLINAFALVYDEFFGEATPNPATLGLFCNPDVLKDLHELCVNSTELLNGLSFRFQNPDGESRKSLVGNFSLHLRREHLETIRRLKLGDILAASSCFPVGFEPMVFPGDFAYDPTNATAGLSETDLRKALYSRDPVSEATRLVERETAFRPESGPASEQNGGDQPVAVRNSAQKTTGLQRLSEDAEDQAEEPAPTKETDLTAEETTAPKAFGLMDGGIDDNQGIQSLLLADRRARKSPRGGFDLLIVCDVASPFLGEPYATPAAPTGRGWKKSLLGWYQTGRGALKTGRWIGLVSFLLGLGLYAVVPGTYPFLLRVLLSGVSVVLMTIGLLLLVLGVGGQWVGGRGTAWLKNRLKRLTGTFGEVVRKYVLFFLRLPTGLLAAMLTARVKSSILLATDVFLMQIRRLSYQALFEDSRWRHRRIASLVYELSAGYYPWTEARLKKNPRDWKFVLENRLIPSEKIRQTAESARTMATTLWFETRSGHSANQQRDDIIATGQFTLCYSLILYLHRLEKKKPLPPHLIALQTRMLADWEKFQVDPLWMVAGNHFAVQPPSTVSIDPTT